MEVKGIYTQYYTSENMILTKRAFAMCYFLTIQAGLECHFASSWRAFFYFTTGSGLLCSLVHSSRHRPPFSLSLHAKHLSFLLSNHKIQVPKCFRTPVEIYNKPRCLA